MQALIPIVIGPVNIIINNRGEHQGPPFRKPKLSNIFHIKILAPPKHQFDRIFELRRRCIKLNISMLII